MRSPSSLICPAPAAVRAGRRRAAPRLTAVLDHRGFRLVVRWSSCRYGWAAMAMMAGKDLLTNPIFGFVFVWVWVGLYRSPCCQFWRATNPPRTVHAGCVRSLSRA